MSQKITKNPMSMLDFIKFRTRTDSDGNMITQGKFSVTAETMLSPLEYASMGGSDDDKMGAIQVHLSRILLGTVYDEALLDVLSSAAFQLDCMSPISKTKKTQATIEGLRAIVKMVRNTP